MQSPPIRFHFRGKIVEVGDVAPTRTVLEWLREDAASTGTKEGCAEGDCGACTVVIGDRLVRDGVVSLRLRAVNACIQFMPTLDGRALFTIEDLKRIAHHQLHPVQQALVECHGSQCGFCTPGFAMSLFALLETHPAEAPAPARADLADALSGNLCRCTGYRPILDAAERMFDLERVQLDTAAVLADLDALHQAREREGDRFVYTQGAQTFCAPRSLAAFARARAQWPAARVLAGSTDIGLWVNKQFRILDHLLYVGRVPELNEISDDGKALTLGAAVTLTDAWDALGQRVPSVREIGLRFASVPVRNAGTLGGNVANGSPIGDGAPVLMSLGASLRLRCHDTLRVLPLDAFYLDYMRNALQPGEFIEAIEVPLPEPATQVRAYKISKRADCDISAVCAGLSVTLNNDIVEEVRFAFGGMAAIVKRAVAAEHAVRGRAWSQASVEAAMAALEHDFSPLTDLRASASFRMRVARNLLQRFWLETRSVDPMQTHQIRVLPQARGVA